MKNRGITRAAVLAAMIASASVMPSSAHTLWINFTDYMPTVSQAGTATSKLYVGWGHHFPVDGFVKRDDFESISLITPTGAVKSVALQTEGIGASALHFDEPGTYMAAMVRKPSMYTTYRENGKEVKVKGSKEGKSDVVSSYYSQQFAKSLVRVGNTSGDVSRVLGHTLELVPLSDPYELANNRGGRLAVKVLLDGKPLVYAKVTGAYEGYSNDDEYSTETMTDANGVAQVRIDHWGVWVLKVRAERPAVGALEKDTDTEKYYASLTFLVP